MPVPSDKVILVSFPKSGSNWVRYCLEHFSGLRTPGSVRILLVPGGPTVIDRKHFLRKGDRQIWRANTLNSNQRPERPAAPTIWPLARLRRRRNALRLLRLQRERRVLLLLRSPFALYARAAATAVDAMRGYLGNIQVFDGCQRDKLLVYYEDLVGDFREMERVLNFVGIPYNLADFDVAEHQKRSLQLYGEGHTKPLTAANVLDLTYHSRHLDRTTRSALRSFCRESLGEETYTRYLGRYDAEAEPGAAALPTRPADGTL
jgi:hypothetical protein